MAIFFGNIEVLVAEPTVVDEVTSDAETEASVRWQEYLDRLVTKENPNAFFPNLSIIDQPFYETGVGRYLRFGGIDDLLMNYGENNGDAYSMASECLNRMVAYMDDVYRQYLALHGVQEHVLPEALLDPSKVVVFSENGVQIYSVEAPSIHDVNPITRLSPSKICQYLNQRHGPGNLYEALRCVGITRELVRSLTGSDIRYP